MTVSFTQFISFLFIALFTSLLYISSCFYLTLFPFTSHCLEQYTLYQGLKYWMPTFLHSDKFERLLSFYLQSLLIGKEKRRTNSIIDLTYQQGACYILFNSASGRRVVWMDGSIRPGDNSCSVFTSWYKLHSRHVNCSDVAKLKSKHKGAACKKSKIGRKR